MREVLRDIQTGKFARDWIEENEKGKPNYDALLAADLDQPIEKVGARLRQHMAWLQEDKQPEAKAA
jgi:ketol-acid reductoisomerase